MCDEQLLVSFWSWSSSQFGVRKCFKIIFPPWDVGIAELCVRRAKWHRAELCSLRTLLF